jgi:hypothetical protein
LSRSPTEIAAAHQAEENDEDPSSEVVVGSAPQRNRATTPQHARDAGGEQKRAKAPRAGVPIALPGAAAAAARKRKHAPVAGAPAHAQARTTSPQAGFLAPPSAPRKAEGKKRGALAQKSAQAAAGAKKQRPLSPKSSFDLKLIPRRPNGAGGGLGAPVTIRVEEGTTTNGIRAAYAKAVKLPFGIPNLAPSDLEALFETFASLKYRLFFTEAHPEGNEIAAWGSPVDPFHGRGEHLPWGKADNVEELIVEERVFQEDAHSADVLIFTNPANSEEKRPAVILGTCGGAASRGHEFLLYLALAERHSEMTHRGANCQGCMFQTMAATRAQKAWARAVALKPLSAEARSGQLEFLLNAGAAETQRELVVARCNAWV